MARTFAYVRVSTLEQTVDNQLREIEAAGFAIEKNRIVEEPGVSGSSAAAQRPKFQRLLERLELGDCLIVTKLDRLGRNTIDILQTVEKLATMGVRVHCLALGGMDLTSPAGRMTMGVIAAVAQFERDLLIERTLSGQARAKAAGVKFGRKPKLNNGERIAALDALASGASISSVARNSGASRATILRLKSAARVAADF